MNNPFDVLVYLDEILVKNLSSLVLTGFIETVTLTQSFDNTLSAGMQEGHRSENTSQDSITRIEREGFKDKNKLDSNNDFEHYHYDRALDARRCVREEKKVQTTFTTFVLNRNLIDYFNENEKLHKKNEDDIENDNIEVGDIIELEGTITNNSLVSYVDTLINLMDVFGCDYLDTLTKDCSCNLTFTRFYKMLTYLKKVLCCNNTQDVIMKSGNGTVILTVSTDNFMNNKCSVFDKINCHCKIVGKVVKTCSEDCDSISLLRKTGQEEFYEKFFEKSRCLIKCLEDNDIFVPQCPNLRMEKCAIQVMPINIYM